MRIQDDAFMTDREHVCLLGLLGLLGLILLIIV